MVILQMILFICLTVCLSFNHNNHQLIYWIGELQNNTILQYNNSYRRRSKGGFRPQYNFPLNQNPGYKGKIWENLGKYQRKGAVPANIWLSPWHMGADTAMITGGSVQIIDIIPSKWLLAIMFLYFSRIITFGFR